MTNTNKSFLKYAFLTVSCVLTLCLTSMWINPVQARVTFKSRGKPAPTEGTVGGGTRDGNSCTSGDSRSKSSSVVKLLPKSNIGLTLAEHPSVMVYVPVTTAKTAFFSVQDEDSNHHYQTTIELPEQGGVVEIKLPDSLPALETGKNYQYYLVMMCGESSEPDYPYVSGWIQRVKPKANLINQKASVELATQLAGDGIWFDAVSVLAKLRKSQPNNQYLAKSWEQLLNSAGLGEISGEPIVN